MSELGKSAVSKLNDDNYFNWKFKMEMLLMKESLWDTVNSEKPEVQAEITAWTKKDNEARAWIVLSVEDNQLNLIRNAKTSGEVWKLLKDHHEKNSLTTKVHLMRKICNLKLVEGENLMNHLDQMLGLFQKLRDLGEEALTDKWIMAMLLSSLPSSYDPLITALESKDEKDLSLNFVKSKLISEYQRKSDVQDISKMFEDTAMKVSHVGNKESFLCYFCKESGHLRRNCDKFKAWKEKNENSLKSRNESKKSSEDNFAFTVSKMEKNWYIDSGASAHICCERKSFVNFDPNYKAKIVMANGENIETKGKGKVVLNLLNEKDETVTATLHDVLYIPEVEGNLLSIKSVVNRGFTVKFDSNKCELKTKDEKQIAVGYLYKNLYKLKIAKRNVEVQIKRNHKKNQEESYFYYDLRSKAKEAEIITNIEKENESQVESQEAENQPIRNQESEGSEENFEVQDSETDQRRSMRASKGIPPSRFAESMLSLFGK